MFKKIPTLSFLAAAGVALLTLNPALGDQALKPQTQQDLKVAMQSEALAVLKYRAFAQHAREEGKIAFAELLEQTAEQEQQHFMELARLYGLARQDWNNLTDAIVGEYGERLIPFESGSPIGSVQLARQRFVMFYIRSHDEPLEA